MKSKNLLLIFTKNPNLGKCKTRLAASIGDKKALEVYKFLLQHTAETTENLPFDKWVFYSEEVIENDSFSTEYFSKKVQQGKDLGERMQNAFTEGFQQGYERISIIGSDLYELSSEDLKKSFQLLEKNDTVIGPAEDGGYYLLGLSKMVPEIFQQMEWSTESVLKETQQRLNNKTVTLLSTKNDIDTIEDIEHIEAIQQLLQS